MTMADTATTYSAELAQERLASADTTAAPAAARGGTWGIKFALAVMGDLLSIIPLLGSVIGPLFYAGLAFSMHTSGLSLMKSGRFAGMILTPLIEFFLSFLPSLTAFVLLCYVTRNK
jgi:hypothetical protein